MTVMVRLLETRVCTLNIDPTVSIRALFSFGMLGSQGGHSDFGKPPHSDHVPPRARLPKLPPPATASLPSPNESQPEE